MNKFLRFYIICACFLNVVASLFLLWEVISRHPINHAGYNPLWFLGLSALTLGSLAAPWFFPKRKKLAIATWGGLVLLVVVVTQFNILLQYETWLGKGMPEWGKAGVVEKVRE